jgi:uncharacterized damage-inducible protein DinB
MNDLPRQLANHVNRTVTGPMWHGPSLNEVLDGVTPDIAAAHARTDAHSIWELVLHVKVWAEVARARLRGERVGDPPPAEDWPPVGDTTAAAWTSAVERMRESYRTLADEVKQLDDAGLSEKISGLDYTVSNLLHGVIEHGTYHCGQIAILKKFRSREPVLMARCEAAEASFSRPVICP